MATERSAVIDKLRSAFLAAVKDGQPEGKCASIAIEAVGTLPASALPPRPPAPLDGMAVTTVSGMLARSAERPVFGSIQYAGAKPTSDATKIRAIGAIEQAAGTPAHRAAATAASLVADVDFPVTHIARIEPPFMTQAAFCAALRTLIDQLNHAAPRDVAQAA